MPSLYYSHSRLYWGFHVSETRRVSETRWKLFFCVGTCTLLLALKANQNDTPFGFEGKPKGKRQLPGGRRDFEANPFESAGTPMPVSRCSGNPQGLRSGPRLSLEPLQMANASDLLEWVCVNMVTWTSKMSGCPSASL